MSTCIVKFKLDKSIGFPETAYKTYTVECTDLLLGTLQEEKHQHCIIISESTLDFKIENVIIDIILVNCGYSDSSVVNSSQIPGVIGAIQKCYALEPSTPFSLKKLKTLFPETLLVGFALNPKKVEFLLENKLFHSDQKMYFIPMPWNDEFANVANNLSAPLDSCLVKASEQVASLHLKKSQGFISALSSVSNKIHFSGTLSTQQLLLDRLRFLNLLSDQVFHYNTAASKGKLKFHCPAYLGFSRNDFDPVIPQTLLEYPVICKTRVASGNSISHKVAVVSSWDGIVDYVRFVNTFNHDDDTPKEFESFGVPNGIIVQSFIDHGNTSVLKVFVTRYVIHIVTQHSIPNNAKTLPNQLIMTESTSNCYIFDSSRLKKLGASSTKLSMTIEYDGSEWHKSQVFTAVGYSDKFLSSLTKSIGSFSTQLCCELKTFLFGYDVVVTCDDVANSSPILNVVDINFFPSYRGVPNVATHIHASLSK